MTQNKKKGIAKKALSISLVAAMLATSNVPAWASGFEAVDAEGFAVEEATDLLADTAEISDVKWEGSLEDGKAVYVYDGMDHKPVITSFTYGGEVYTPNTPGCTVDYTYPDDTVEVSAAERKITVNFSITLVDNTVVTGAQDFDYVIKAIKFADANISVPSELAYDVTGDYDLEAKDITVSMGDVTLVNGQDYEVATEFIGTNKVGAKVEITIEGNGNYAGKIVRHATVKAADISELKITKIDDQDWTGNEVKPKITLTDAENTTVNLTKDTDYEVSYSNNVNPGTANVTVKGIGNYTGTVTATFQIVSSSDWTELVDAITADVDAKTFTYTGSPINAVDNVYGSGKYVLGRDFTVSYAPQNTNVGDVIMTVTGLGTYAGKSATIELEIEEKNIADDDVKVTVADIPYTPDLKADAIKDAITVTYKGMTLREKNDFTFAEDTLSFANGKLSVTLNGIGNYIGTKNVTKTVTAKDISTVTLPTIANKVYDGSPYTVAKLGTEFVLKDGTKELTKDVDYVVVREYNNKNVGMATIEIAGRGNYVGTATINFLIVEKELKGTIVMANGSPILADQDYSYEKASSDDGITVKEGLKVVGTDGSVLDSSAYKFVYENNQEVGTATVSAVETNKNTTVVIAKATFRIVPAALPGTAANVVLDKNAYTYTGSAIEPKTTITLTDGKYTLVEGTDYEVSYKDNVNVSSNAPYVIVTGKGNYAKVVDNKINTIEKDFDITQAQITTADIIAKDVTYAGGIVVKEDITIKNPESGVALVKDTDYTLTFVPNMVEVGRVTATIALTTEAAKNYNLIADTVNFNITKKALSDCKASVEDGKVVIKNGELTVPATEYTVVENEDGSFTVTAKPSGNYTGSIVVEAEKVDATTLRVTDRTTSTVSLAWDEVEGAEGYTIWFRSEYETSVSRKIVQGGDVTTWTQKGLQPGTKYFYTVKAWVKDAEGKYVFSEQSPVQRGTTKPLAAKITAVSAANGKVKVTLAGKAAGAEMYSMCYSKSASFDDFKVGIRTSYTTRTFKNALTAGTYYVRVKSYRDLGNNKRVYGAWSNTMKVVVK